MPRPFSILFTITCLPSDTVTINQHYNHHCPSLAPAVLVSVLGDLSVPFSFPVAKEQSYFSDAKPLGPNVWCETAIAPFMLEKPADEWTELDVTDFFGEEQNEISPQR